MGLCLLFGALDLKLIFKLVFWKVAFGHLFFHESVGALSCSGGYVCSLGLWTCSGSLDFLLEGGLRPPSFLISPLLRLTLVVGSSTCFQ